MKIYANQRLLATGTKEWLELNKGREGKTLLSPEGNELKDTMYLGNGDYAKRDQGKVSISTYVPRKDDWETFYINEQTFRLLKKF